MSIVRPMSWEELYAIPGFSEGPFDQAAMVAGEMETDYDMPKKQGMRPCGIKSCQTNHLAGIVVRMNDGTASNMGIRCARKHFGSRWKSVKRAFREREDEAARAVARREATTAAERVLNEVFPTSEDEFEWATKMLRQFDTLPPGLVNHLEKRARDRDPEVRIVRDLTKEEREKYEGLSSAQLEAARTRRIWIDGILAVSATGRADRSLARSRDKAHALRNLLSEGTADEIYEAIRSLRSSRERAVAACASAREFFRQANFDRFRFLGDAWAGVRSISCDPEAEAIVVTRR